jgi:hypothetical protein
MTNVPVSPVVEMKIGGEWVDITADVRLGDADSGGGVDITRGMPNEGNAAEPTQVDFVLNNAGGKYSPKNPLSENYGLLGRNTPVRFALSRREDDFDRTEVDSWGRLPNWTDAENVTHIGDRWQIVGTSSAFDVASGEGTIQASTGYRMALFGEYGDVEIKTRVKVSALDSEFGIVMRAADVSIGTDAGDFESGLLTWRAFGGTSTLEISTTQFHTGTQSALLTVAGSPASTYPRCDGAPVTPGNTYRARMWVRCSASITVTAAIDFLDADFNYVSGGYNPVAVTADTWTVLEVTALAPDAAAFGSYGSNLGSSPANGTLLWIDDVEFLDLSSVAFYTAYITPGSPDLLRLGTIAPHGVSTAVSQSRSVNVATGEWWWMKAQMSGIRRRVKFWKDGDDEPTTWNWRTYEVAAASLTSARPPATGMVGVFAKDGTALVTFDSIEVNVWRAHAEIAELPPRWDLSRQDRWVPISARGILRRLGQGRKALESPVTLHLGEYTTSKMWIPLETVDGNSSIAGNRIEGGQPALIKNLTQGSVDAVGEFAAPGISGCAVFDQDDSYLIARATPGASPGTWSLMCFLRIPSAVASDVLLYTVESSGTARRYYIWYTSGGGLRVEARSDVNAILSQSNSLIYFSPEIPQGSWVAANLYVSTDGANTDWAWNFHKPGTEDFFSISGTHAGTVGIFREVHFYSNALLTAAGNLQLAHVFHYPGDLPFVTYDFARAAYAYTGEECIARAIRLASNAQIALTTTGFTSESKPMGPQTPAKTLDLIEEAMEVDDSILMEERDDFGLNIRSRESLYNQNWLDLDIDAGHLSPPLEPNNDDQRTRNDVTVRRPNGSFARSIQTEGPLNVNAPEDDPDGVGVYDESKEMNFETDDQLQPAANWRRSRGTIDDPRYPSIKADLVASAYNTDPALTAAILAKDSGDLLRIFNSETDYNWIEQIIQGYTEHIDQYEHTLTFVANPGRLWRVGDVGVTTRLGTRYQFLDGSFDAGTDVRLSAEVVGRPTSLPYDGLWVQVAESPESFPFEIEVSGVRLRVHATGDVLNGNGYFDEGIDGWVGVDATLYWDRYYGQYKGATPGALRITGTVAASYNWAEVDATLRATVVAGQEYQASAWMMTDVTMVGETAVDVDWFDSSDVFISTTSGTPIDTTSYEWVHFAHTHTAPVGAVYARPVPYSFFTDIGDILWADDVRLMPVASFESSPQTLSVDQAPTNGVEKTLTDGSPITVVDPWRIAF